MASPARGKHRLRASKACQRCSRRKAKCDATQVGCPCSRCRVDNISDCTLITSRRGTYDRKNFRRPEAVTRPRIPASASSSSSSPSQPLHPDQTAPLARVGGTSSNGNQPEAPASPLLVAAEDRPPSSERTNLQESLGDTQAVGLLACPSDTGPSTFSAASTGHQSLSSMFEDFLGQRGHEDLCKAKLVLFGEPSPLTFALKLHRDMDSSLHDTSQRILNSDSLTAIDDNVHLKHLPPHDIELLKAKGTFIYPEQKMLEEIITVFLDRVYPIYSVVNPAELRKAQQKRKIPWILLHSICFITMTFCEPAVIYKAGFNSRAEARQLYYDRAKALFDMNYENSKIILVKVAILLSFKGPQMDCYWNPCSWIEFGVTMAVALGMHRKSVAINETPNDRGLLRRLWWTLAIRDAHCSALLGRPFRINIIQCDIAMLTLDDFPDEHASPSSSSQPFCSCRESFEYQIHVAKLSLILRNIMQFRFGPSSNISRIEHLQEQLSSWKFQLPPSMQSLPGQSSISTSAVQLEILLNYHIMLLHMDQPGLSRLRPASPTTSLPGEYNSVVHTESSALVISSSAIKLMTRSSICVIPHEVFPGFFVAGIAFYQQAKQAQSIQLARMIRASFDNCQILLNQAQNTWDPGVWAMKVFEFLQSAADAGGAVDVQIPQDDPREFRTHTPSMNVHRAPSMGPHTPGYSFAANSSWSEMPSLPGMEIDRNSAMDIPEYMLLPNFFTFPFGN